MLPPLLLLLCLLAGVLAPSAAGPVPHGPPTLYETVQTHLASGGHAAIRAALDLPRGVYYDPLRFFTREDRLPLDGEQLSSRNRASDLSLLRALGMHIPGVDPVTQLTSRATITSCDKERRRGVHGDKSSIHIDYSRSAPATIFAPVEYALRLWADEFSSKEPIRICFVWGGSLEDLTLGATNSPFFIDGSDHDKLKDGVSYSPALASMLEGRDVIPSDYHVHMTLNDKIPWHMDNGIKAPFKKYDLATTVLHELTHGLFFSGTIKAKVNRREAEFSEKRPARFDTFMKADRRIGVASMCANEKRGLFNAITHPDLRFIDEATGASFGLYSPAAFVMGSSTYHFHNESLKSDCAGNNIAESECSDLMTHQLNDGYTQHRIGETTLRVLRAMQSSDEGVGGGDKCDLPDNPIPESSNSQGVGEDGLDFKLPTWGIATVAIVAGVGSILVFGVVISSVVSRRDGRSGGT